MVSLGCHSDRWTDPRPASSPPTVRTKSSGNTGFATYRWKPAVKAFCRSSARACAVSATAGVTAIALSVCPHLADEGIAVLARHRDIADDDFRPHAFDERERARRTIRHFHRRTGSGENLSK